MAVQESSLVRQLRGRHRGPVIAPDDLGYDAARLTFNGMIDRRPAFVTRPLDVSDVVATVELAAEAELPISVRGGGHGVAGLCVGDGSVVIDLRLIRDVTVDPDLRTAICGGGATWDDLDPRSQRHGLATPGGTFGDTGIAGLTLGGGIGHLSALYGLTLDNLIAATVVTADGSVMRASDDENAELFWALRGGGGNFGVVVDFTYRLHPVGRLLGGLLLYRFEDAVSVVSAWRELMATAPDELMCVTSVARNPFGEERTQVSVAYFGEPDDGCELIQPLLEAAPPVVHSVRLMHYPELQDIFGRMPFGLRNYWSGRFLRELPDEVIALSASHLSAPEVFGAILLEPLHGAVTRVPSEATAFAGREARYNATFLGFWLDARSDEQQITAARAYSSALAPWAFGGGYLNYASEQAGGSLETEFGAVRFQRLRAVKREFDPTNMFRFNHNIAPD
jgi:FAD/FMN-containing dehydrogenase